MYENDFFQPDQIIPDGQETRIVELSADPFADRRRVGVSFRLTPFSTPPSVKIRIFNSEQQELASSELINLLHLESEITLHLPANRNSPGEYQVILDLFRLEDEAGDEGQTPQIKQIDLHTKSCSFILQ